MCRSARRQNRQKGRAELRQTEDVDLALASEILRRLEADQVPRRRLMQLWHTPGEERTEVSCLVRDVDADNCRWLRRVLDEVGWPGRTLVGEQAAIAVCHLAQHADRDPALQQRCLDLMRVASEAGDAPRDRVAHLTDRVLINAGKEQVFGSQFLNGEPVRLADPDGVDERRAEYGLRSLSDELEYRRQRRDPRFLTAEG